MNVRENTEGGGAGGTGGKAAAIEKVLRDMGYVPVTFLFMEGKCDRCGELIFSEWVRPAVVENWIGVSAHWLKQLQAHVCGDPF